MTSAATIIRDFNDSRPQPSSTAKEPSRVHMTAGTWRIDVTSRRQLLWGWLLLGFTITAYAWQPPLDWLALLQQSSVYKQFSGFVLGAYILGQWRLAYVRMRSRTTSAKSIIALHKTLGAAAPVLLYSHSMTLGYGYAFAFATLYLINAAVGLCNYQTLNIRAKWYISAWVSLHVALAAITLALLVFHVYMAYGYS